MIVSITYGTGERLFTSSHSATLRLGRWDSIFGLQSTHQSRVKVFQPVPRILLDEALHNSPHGLLVQNLRVHREHCVIIDSSAIRGEKNVIRC